jgi:hypothetical protein
MGNEVLTILYFIIGLAISALFAMNYFNQPSYRFAEEEKGDANDQEDLMLEPALPKLLTDRNEYYLYLIAFVIVTEMIYIFLIFFLPDLLLYGSDVKQDLPKTTTQRIFLSALIVTGIAPNIPFIRQLLEKSKFYLHNKAQIPGKGRNVYYSIKSHHPHYSQDVITNILQDDRYACDNGKGVIARPDLSAADFVKGPLTLESQWAKLTYLLFFVDKWSDNTPFLTCINSKEFQRSAIDRSYNGLQAMMTHYKNGTLPGNDVTLLNTRVNGTLYRTYRLISCLLYSAVKTDTRVKQYLNELGYATHERTGLPIPLKKVMPVILSIVCSVFAGTFLSNIILNHFQAEAQINTHQVLQWTLYTIPFITVPVLLVLLLKWYLSSHSEAWPAVTDEWHYKNLGDRPWQVYAMISLTAYFFGGMTLFLSIVFVKLITLPDLLKLDLHGLNLGFTFRASFVWSWLILVTAGFTAFRLDSITRADIPQYVQIPLRITGALLQGAATALTIYLSFIHTYNNGKFDPSLMASDRQGQLIVFILIAFILGTLLYTVTGFGSLKQQRATDRQQVKRQVLIRSGKEEIAAQIINVSKEGAFIESQGFSPEGKTSVEISDSTGTSVVGLIVKGMGKGIHLHFTDTEAWLKVLAGLNIQRVP